MKSTEELLKEIYNHFPESEDQDETLCNLITDSLASIDYWNTKELKPKDETKYYWEDRIWEDIKNGRSFVLGDEDNKGSLDLNSILSSLNKLKKHSPEVYEEIQSEYWDAESCDVFIQTAVFGEVVFG